MSEHYSGVQQFSRATQKDKQRQPFTHLRTIHSLVGASNVKTHVPSQIYESVLRDWLRWPLNRKVERNRKWQAWICGERALCAGLKAKLRRRSSTSPPLGDADPPVTPPPVTAVWNLTGVRSWKAPRQTDRFLDVVVSLSSSDQTSVCKCTVFD